MEWFNELMVQLEDWSHGRAGAVGLVCGLAGLTLGIWVGWLGWGRKLRPDAQQLNLLGADLEKSRAETAEHRALLARAASDLETLTARLAKMTVELSECDKLVGTLKDEKAELVAKAKPAEAKVESKDEPTMRS